MNPNTMPLEAETRVLIDRSLENLGWKLSGKDQNVYYEQPRSEAEKKKLCGKRPDYVLYSKDSDKPLIVIEAKKKGVRLDSALEQGIQYAKAIEAPLVFATDGVFCKAFHTVANRPPILNGEEIDEFIREALALRYLTSYEVNTVSPKVQYDRKELIRIFDEANNMLRGEGLRAGIERFGEFANILFLKLISESEQIKRESGIPTKFDVACSWDSIKQIPISTRIEYINKTVYDKLNGNLVITKEIFVDDSVNLAEEKRLRKDDIFICMSSGSKDHIGKVAYIDQDTKYYAGGFMGIIRTNPQKCIPKYLYYYLLLSGKFREEIKILTQGANINNISSTINAISIPLPPLEKQNQIVSELSSYHNVITSAQKIVSSYTPILSINPSWVTVKLGDIFEVVSDLIDPQSKTGNINYIGLENIESHSGKIVGQIECNIQSIKSTKRIFAKGDVLFGKLRPALNKVAYANCDGICSTDIIVLRAKDKNIMPEFYSILLRNADFNAMVLNGCSGGQLPRVDIDYLLDLPIHNVPKDEQEQLMAQIVAEESLIAPSEQMITLFSEKLKHRTKEIWGE